MLEKTLDLDCTEMKPVNPKGDQPFIFIEGLLLKLKLQYFGHMMQNTDSLKKTLMLGKVEGKRKGDDSRGDGWMASLAHWNMSLSKFSEIVKDREVWQAAVHGAPKSQT